MAKMFSSGANTAMGQHVEKATSHLLIGPDWGSNMEICDVLNTDPSKTRDVVKTVKKRLLHKDPKVQLLTLTLLETIMKNCGQNVHATVAEKEIPQEMVKLVKKKSNSQVRERALELLDVWQEAFGGNAGRYRQYWIAYIELRNAGITFPPRREESSGPAFLPQQQPDYSPQLPPPPPHGYYPHVPHPHYPIPAFGMPPVHGSPHSPVPADAAGGESALDNVPMSLVDIANARSSLEVLAEMLSAVDPNDKNALKDELIVELVEQCTQGQQRVMAMVNSTGDEELLRQGLTLNDELQKVLSKHASIQEQQTLQPEQPLPAAAVPATLLPRFDYEEESVDDEFGQLAQRSSVRRGSLASPQQSSTQPTVTPPGGVPQAQGNSVDLLGGGLDALLLTGPTAPLQQSPAPSPTVPQPAVTGPPTSAPPPSQPLQQSQQPMYSYEYTGVVSGNSQPANSMPTAGTGSGAASYSSGFPVSSSPQTVSDNPFDEGNYGAPTFHASPTSTNHASQQQQPQQPQYSSFQAQPQAFNTTPPPVYMAGGGYPPQQQQQQQTYAPPQYIPAPPVVENTYVAPWAMAAPQPMSEQQRALIYGSNSTTPQLSPAVLQQPPMKPITGTLSPQQQSHFHGNSPPPLPPTTLALPAPASSTYGPGSNNGPDIAAALSSISKNNNNSTNSSKEGVALGKAMPASTAPKSLTPQQLAKNEDPLQSLFGDLVDLRSSRESLGIKGPGKPLR